MNSKLHLNEDFVEEVISVCIRKKDFYQSIQPHLLPKYMPNDDYREIWEEIRYIYDTASRVSYGLLKSGLVKNRGAVKLVNSIKKVSIDIKPEDLVDGLEQYIKQSKFMDYYDQLAKSFNRGEKEGAYAKFIGFAEEFSKFSLQSDIMVNRIFEDYNNRDFERALRNEDLDSAYVPLGIPDLDNLMGGGPKRGEATMICGRTGTGKSFWSIHTGLAAARRGFKVLHVQLEGTEQQVLDRYDAAWTGRLYREIKNGDPIENQAKVSKINKVLANIRGEIFVKAFERMEAISMNEIRNYYYELAKEHDIALIIIDYFELSTPGDQRYDAAHERQRQDKLGKMCKALAVETNAHVFTPTQSGDLPPEKANSPTFVLTQHNLSEHRTKIKPFDNFFTINMTDQERTQKRARIWVDKLRDSESKKVIPIAQDLAYSKFYVSAATIELKAQLEMEKEMEETEK